MDTSPTVTAGTPRPRSRRPRLEPDPLHSAVGRVGAARRWRGPDHPDTIAAEREVAVTRLTIAAREYRAVGMPPMDPDQVEVITAILCDPTPVEATP